MPIVEIAYSWLVHNAIGKVPFEVAYGFNPDTPLDLLPKPPTDEDSRSGVNKARQIQQLHQGFMTICRVKLTKLSRG